MTNWIKCLVQRFERWLLNDGLNHDWEEDALTSEQALQTQAYLRDVEDRAPQESHMKALNRMGGIGPV